MRNLKRALSLALAAIMLIGMMVIGASATDYKDFTDNGDIVNRDAVTMLTTLGVIDGKPDGTYAPTELVTRDQMAKMISVILNQGADVNDVYANLDSGLTDISSNWAKGHINYCYTLGVIAGRGDGTFDPGANVTAAEAAKMLLVAAGYDPTTEGFVGAQWSWNVNAKASSLGIYKNYTKGVLEPLNRDDAALLIYNALDIERIERYENGYARVYNDNRTILSSLYGVYKVVGVVIGNEWAQLEQTGIQDALAPGKTRVAQMNVLASDTLQTQIWANGIPSVYQFNVSTEEALLGKAVTMFIRKETILNNIEVLGVVYNEDLNTVVTLNSNKTALSDATKDTGLSIRSEGTNKTEFYVNYGYQATSAAAQTELGIDRANRNGIVMEIIDNNDDGVVDYVLYKKEDLAVVSGLSRDGESVTIRGVNDNKSIDKDDMVTNLELALDDVVLVITYGGRYYVTEPQIVTGEMNSYTANRETEQSIEVDGATYKPSFIGRLTESVTSANGVGDIIDFDVLKCEEPTGVDFDITYDFFLDSNGFVRAFRPTEQSLPNYALVLNSGYDPGVYSSEASGKVTVLLADGTEGTYPINFSTSASNLAKQLMYTGSASIAGTTFSKADRGVIELKGFLGTDYTDNSPTRPWRFEDGVDTNANTYVFAYDNHNTESDAVNGNVNPNDYKAGQAAGYVIRYTLNDSGVMTIQSVMGTVAPGYAVNLGMYTNTDLSVTDRIHTLSTRQGTLSTAYASGNARVYYAAGQAVAVDKNTVAFYYDEVEAADLATGGKYANRTDVSEGDILYGVAVGYENMADVRQGGQFLASNIVSTTYNSRTDSYEYESTNLADMILFDEANVITARDYAFVVDTNTRDSSNVTLNVIFEDGKAGTLTISRSNYDNVIEDRDGFQKPYAYTIGADDKATIYDGSPIGEGRVWRLQNGTVAMDSVQQFWPYSVNTVNIWDVTDLDEGEDGVKMADFVRDNNGINYRGYLILNTDGSVRTAFIWESDDTTPVVGHSHDWNWRLTDSTTLYPYSSIANINDEFTAGHDVTIRGDYTVSGSSFLYIPEGRTLRVEGNFTQNVRIYGGGKLWVGGDYTMNYDGIEVTTQIDGDLILRDTTPDINALVGVKGDVTETVPGSVTLTIGAYDSANSTGGDLHMIGAASDVEVQHLTINGHMEAVHINVPGNVIINSTNTLIARGNVTIGTLTIGGTAAGSMTVMGTFDVNTANVNEGTLNLQGATNVVHTTMTVGTATKTATVALGQSSLALSNGATLTVDDKGTVTANNVTLASGATSATVNVDGTVTLGGELNAGTGTVTVASTGKVTVETVNKDTVVSNEGVVTVNKTSNDPVKVQGASLNGTFAGDVTLSAASTIKADDTMTVNGKFDGASKTLTMEAGSTLVLNGKANVLPTFSATAGAKIVFGNGATVGTDSTEISGFVMKDGTTAVAGNKVAGLTFTYDSTKSKWVADKDIAVAADASIDVENVTTSLDDGDYSITADASAKTVTVVVKNPNSANEAVTSVVLNVPTSDTVAVATNNATWNSANKTLTVSGLTGTPKTVKLTVSGEGKTTVTYTFYVSTSATITNAPSQPTEPINPDVGAGE